MLGKIVSAGTTLLLTVALLGIAAAADLPGEPADSQAMDELSRTHYVSESEGDLLVYIITDPQCPHCHTLKKRIRELDTPGIEWRYVTVGFLGGESLKLAADKLERKLSVDGDQAVRKNTKVVTGIGVRAVPLPTDSARGASRCSDRPAGRVSSLPNRRGQPQALAR